MSRGNEPKITGNLSCDNSYSSYRQHVKHKIYSKLDKLMTSGQ